MKRTRLLLEVSCGLRDGSGQSVPRMESRAGQAKALKRYVVSHLVFPQLDSHMWLNSLICNKFSDIK